MKCEEFPIDIFITWVDGNDVEWLKEKSKYESLLPTYQNASADKTRFESWDNLHFLFRALEKNMPWVNNIYLITYGHLPEFLNINHPKLKVIKHSDYIPEEFLPTFNSNVIEMNLHRIEELSENIILFNDDCFPIQYIDKEYYFKNNKVCDEAVERILAPHQKTNISATASHTLLNNMLVINKYFDKRKVQRENFAKWFNLGYGKKLFRNIALSYFFTFDYFTSTHEPMALKKSTFKNIWDIEKEILENASKNKFRNFTDVSWYLIRFWQLCTGEFYPKKREGKFYCINENNYKKISNEIRQKKYPIVSINEDSGRDGWDNNWPMIKAEINAALEELFPDKSSFEL